MVSVPAVPVETAGSIASSSDFNSWSDACTWLLGSGSDTMPVFYLMPGTAQGLTTSFANITNFSSSAALFKDNAGGFSSGTPNRYTIQLPGFYTISWAVSVVSGASYLEALAGVETTSSNPYNPSVISTFQHQTRNIGSAEGVAAGSGLCPFYLSAGDFIFVNARVGVAANTDPSFGTFLSGQWVSA